MPARAHTRKARAALGIRLPLSHLAQTFERQSSRREKATCERLPRTAFRNSRATVFTNPALHESAGSIPHIVQSRECQRLSAGTFNARLRPSDATLLLIF